MSDIPQPYRWSESVTDNFVKKGFNWTLKSQRKNNDMQALHSSWSNHLSQEYWLAILKLLSRYTSVKQISKYTVDNESQVSSFRERT